MIEASVKSDLMGLERRRADLRFALKNYICVPVVSRDYDKINLIAGELELLREKIRGLKGR